MSGHAVKALSTVFRAREQQTGERSRNTSVAVIERMNGDEPQMRDAGFEDEIRVGARIEPAEKRRHLCWNSVRRRGFIMHALAPGRPGHHLHGSAFVLAPCADRDLEHSTVARGKQGGMPRVEPLFGKRFIVVLGGVEHHFDDALDVPIGRGQGADIHAESPRNRRTHMLSVEALALDLTRLEHLLREALERGLAPEREAQALHPAQKPPLDVPDGRQP
jgi:hypothetical protein